MCGITGIFNLNGETASKPVLRKMTDAISHRGPDGEGFYFDSFLGLGHRRLAILDLSAAGHQPMVSVDGLHALSYNGEIYNHKEIRAELETLGYRFHSRTDTEVLLNAYVAWGEQSVKRFNGMFAFAIWDKKNQSLFLARDRYGIKPLYCTLQGSTFLFASEIKAILQHPAYKTRLDKEALLEYFTFQNYFTDRTLFENIRLLPHGSTLTLRLGQTSLPPPKPYWDYCFEESESHGDEEECLEELARLFEQAVKRQLVSDVEVGTYLSGGIDSGAITAIAAKNLPYIKSFTCGFDLHSASGLEMGFDERENAETMSYLFKTEHYELVLKAGDMERILSKLVHHMEEPRVGQSYPNFYVARLAGKFVKVVLSGTGGDELFGGYPWRYYRAVVNENFEEYAEKYYAFWQRLMPQEEFKKVLAPIWRDVGLVQTKNIFRDVFSEKDFSLKRPEDYVNHSLYFEAKTFLHGLLVVEDKLSMAHGLETRLPFLDNDLVDFAQKLPVRMKLGNLTDVVRLNENEPGPKTKKYFEKTRDGKLLFRKMAEKHVPHNISRGEKKGFSAPDASWFKGESMHYVQKKILNPEARIYQFLDRESVGNLVQEHLSGKQNRRLLIWSLLNFEEWCLQFL